MIQLRALYFAAGLALVLPVIAVPPCARAQIGIGVEIGVPPPAERVEVVPPPPHPTGWVWEKGYWRWNGVTHVWIRGHYLRIPRPGAVRVPAHWEQTPNGRWHFIPGHWE